MGKKADKLKKKLKKERAYSKNLESHIEFLNCELSFMCHEVEDLISELKNFERASFPLDDKIRRIDMDEDVTTIIWSDGKTTSAKLAPGDVYDARTGIAMCLAKRFTEGRNISLFYDILNMNKEEKKMISYYHELRSGIPHVCAKAIEKWESYSEQEKERIMNLYTLICNAGLLDYAYTGRVFLLFENTKEQMEVVLNKKLAKTYRNKIGFLHTSDLEEMTRSLPDFPSCSSADASGYLNEVLQAMLEGADCEI